MSRGKIWRRRLALGILGLFVGLVLLVTVAGWAVNSAWGQRTVLDRLARWTRTELGFTVTADGYRLRPWSGSLEIDGLRLAVSDSPPFATAHRVEARFRPASLLRRRLDLERLALERPRVDLAAPLPAAGEPAGDSASVDWIPVTVDRLLLTDGEVRGAEAGTLLTAWRLMDLQGEAAFDGRRLEIENLTARADLELTEGGDQPIELEAELRGSADLQGRVSIDQLSLDGEALRARFSGALGPDLSPGSATFTVTADPGFWLQRRPSGALELRGDLDLEAWQGTVTLAETEQPATLAREFLSTERQASLALADTTLRLGAELRLQGERSVTGTVRLSASRGAELLLQIVAQPTLEMATDLPASVVLEATILPGTDGRRRLTARLESEAGASLDAWRIANGELTVEEPALERLLRRLAGLYPDLLPPTSLAELPALGPLRLEGRFDGPLVNPRIDARGELRPHGDGRIVLTAAGRPAAEDFRLTTSGREIDLAHFTRQAASGRLAWTGGVEDPLGARRGRLEVAGRAVGKAEETILSTLEVRLTGDRGNLDWRLVGDLPGRGRILGTGRVDPTLPLARAGGELTWETGDLRLPLLESDLRLAGGTLEARVRAPFETHEPIEADILVPLAALAAIPGLEGVAELPLETHRGPIAARWSAPEADWTAMLPPELGRRLTRLTAGSSGRLELDPACPACSRGEFRVSGLDLVLDGRRAAAQDDLRLDLDERGLRLSPWSLTGDGFRLEAGGELQLSPGWRVGDDPVRLAGELQARFAATLDSAWLASVPVEVHSPGVISARGEIAGTLDALRGSAEVTAPGLELTPDAYPGLRLTAPAAHLTLADGDLRWEEARLGVADAVVTSRGSARLAEPLTETEGTVRISSGASSGLPVLQELTLPFTIQSGLLRVPEGKVTTAGGEGRLALELPVDARPAGRATLEWSLPLTDWAPLLSGADGAEDPELLELASRGRITVPLDRPGASQGQIVLDRVRISTRGRETRFEPAIELTVADGVARLAPFRLLSGEESFSLSGRARLEREWSPGEAVASLISDFEIRGDGEIDAGLLNPFLVGGRGEGFLSLDLAVTGSPADYGGRLRISGEEAQLLFRSPYLTRLQKPRLKLRIADGRIELEEGTARLNEGSLRLSGTIWDGEGTALQLDVEEALFRLDYGLLATLGANLRFELRPDGSAELAGRLDVERGSLTRALDLDLDLVGELLSPVDLTTTEESFLDYLELDLAIHTREGVRVRNNLADLFVRWEPLAVTGTLARPVIEGRLEADPGGLLHLYGQTVRLDLAAIEYTGVEGEEARLDLEVTTSLEDPTIAQLSGDDPFRGRSTAGEATPGGAAAATEDLARYLGEQVTGQVGEAIGVKLSLRPLLIFGETDPGARLTVSRDLSPFFSIAASVNLRQAEGQTYLLEVHELRPVPNLVAQAYTDDQSTFGSVLLQRQEFGGGRPAETLDLPRIRKIVVEPPRGVSRRGVKRALGLSRGDPFDAERRFAAEVELLDYLAKKGYAAADVEVRAMSAEGGERRTRLQVTIRPGPRAEFVFAGEKLTKPLRQVIKSLYRPDFFEAESLLEMKAETVRALRSLGFLEPSVTIDVQPLGPEHPDFDRRVRIETEGGIRISPEPPVFVGLPPADAAVLDSLFFNTVQRVELAVGLESADRRLLQALADLGYPEARIVTRYESLGERLLTVEIDPGPRLLIAAVEIERAEGAEGRSAADIEALAPLIQVSSGDPLRRRTLTASALAIERKLGSQGHLEARVRTLVEPQGSGQDWERKVRFVVDPGPVARLAELEFQGLRSTRPRWAGSVTELEPGGPLGRGDLARARTELWRTGLFSGVSTQTYDDPPESTRVIFELVERPRFRVAYGLRWDSESGPGAVLDASDQNFLGRNWTLGLRALYSSDEKSLRWLTRVPRVFGGPGAIELFASRSEIRETFFDIIFGTTDIFAEILEGTLQYSHPLSRRTTLRTYGRYTDTQRELPFVTQRIKSPLLGLQYVYDGRSSGPLTRRGTFASVDLSGSDEFLGGDLRYLRLFSQLSLYRPLAEIAGRELDWAQSIRLGLADAFDQELIRDVRFFAGGEYSVRGYETESLGVQTLIGTVVEPAGGAALLILNQELRWRLFEDYTLLIFADAGNVWSEIGELGFDLRTSAGLGLRALTPIGLLRLDLAHALDQRPAIDPEFKLYFGLGTTF